MDVKADPFTYHHTLKGRRFRLLQLKPKDGLQHLRLDLVERNLDSSERYTALSYAWGDPTPCRTVLCNGKWLLLAESLHSFLNVLADASAHERPDFLWADGICINQKNNEEKTEQVRMMRDIYSGAEHVIIWLGIGRPDDDKGIELMELLCKKLPEPKSESATDGLAPGEDLFDFSELGIPIDTSYWRALVDILQRPWFSRVWIIQELCFARSFEFWIGGWIIEPEFVLGVQRILHRYVSVKARWLPHQGTGSPSTSLALALLKTDVDNGYSIPLFNIFFHIRGFKVTDPRDRIFATLPLTAEADLEIIDYGLQLPAVIIQLVRKYFVNKEFDVGLLSFIEHPFEQRIPSQSWVPELQLSETFTPMIAHFPASMPIGKVQAEFVWGHEPLLQIHGKVIDHVRTAIDDETSMPPFTNSPLSRQHVSLALKYDLQRRELAYSLGRYPTGEDVRTAHWKSLVVNVEDPGQEVPEKMLNSYGAWLQTMSMGSIFFEKDPPPKSLAEIDAAEKYVERRWQPAGLSEEDVLKLSPRQYLNQTDVASRTFGAVVDRLWPHRKYFSSRAGYLGWAPYCAEIGDQICLFHGCRIPYVVRAIGDKYRLVGACYMYGLMNGEVIGASAEEEVITLF